MKKEEVITIKRALSDSSLHGKHSDGTGRTGTSSAAQEYPYTGFGPQQSTFGSSFHYPLSSSQKRAIYRVSCPSDWRGLAYLSGRNSFFDLPSKPSSPSYPGAELLLKTEPVSLMGDQQGVPNLNEGEEDAAQHQP